MEAGTSPLWLSVLAVLDGVTPFRLEWIAAVAGVLSTAGGLAFAVLGTRTALDAALPTWRLLLPLGALVYVAVPSAWDFTTSGLDTGLGLLWLGIVWWLLARRVASSAERERPPPAWVAIVVGLGPVVRPDFALFSFFFVVALLATSPRRARSVVRTIAWAVAVPFVVELARMAYFASIVPNPAIAKEAGRSYWDQGWTYFGNFVGGFVLWVPVALAVTLVVAQLWKVRSPDARCFRVVASLVIASGTAHALYVTRVGGDFMVGRLLLPALFVILLPASVVQVKGWRWVVALAVVAWALVCMLWLRVDHDFTSGIVDERRYWSELVAMTHNPVTLDSYANTALAQGGRRAARLADGRRRLLMVDGGTPGSATLPLARDVPATVVANIRPLGIFSYAAGLDVHVVDTSGLADTTASHLRVDQRGRPGHEKERDLEWVIAEYTDADRLSADDDGPAVIAARRALGCGDLRALHRATRDPLDLGRMFDNLTDAVTFTNLRYSRDPVVAARELCGPGR